MFTLLVSCDDEGYDFFELNTPDDTMLLTPSDSIIVLQEEWKDDIALTLEWGSAADRGEGTKITYFFKMDLANNNFESSIPKIELEPEQRSISFTHEELNNYIIEYWEKEPGSEVELEAEIIAEVTEYKQYMKPEVTKTKLIVTSYAITPINLYLYGNVSESNDEWVYIRLDNIEMNKKYFWRGDLEVGDFKIVESKENMLPSYNKGDDERTLVKRTDENEPDHLFTVDTTGPHSVYINIEEMLIVHAYSPYVELYMVGDATPAVWDIDKAHPMEWSYKDPQVFTYEGHLNEGEIKMPLWTGDWNADYFMPVVAGAGVDDNRVQFVPGGKPNNKWLIEEAGNYRITINIVELTIDFEKL